MFLVAFILNVRVALKAVDMSKPVKSCVLTPKISMKSNVVTKYQSYMHISGRKMPTLSIPRNQYKTGTSELLLNANGKSYM